MRTISNIETLMIPLENIIRSILLPALLNGYSCSDMEKTCSRFQQNLAVWAYSNIKKDARLSMPIHPR